MRACLLTALNIDVDLSELDQNADLNVQEQKGVFDCKWLFCWSMFGEGVVDVCCRFVGVLSVVADSRVSLYCQVFVPVCRCS